MVRDNIKAKNANWKFSGDIVNNFEEHISRSVPFYNEGHDIIVKLSDYFVKEDSICYEIGCSVGTLSYKLSCHNSFKKKAKFIGIEIEKDMIDKAKKIYSRENLSFFCEDINFTNFEKSDFINSYYTIQFIHPKFRQDLINKIYDSLNWGGALILFEKVRANDARFQDIMTGIYNDYKLEKGFSKEEIFEKTRSLKGILEPFSSEGNFQMLKRAGFVDIMTIMKSYSFEGVIAIK